jgi:hypothetical protein
MGTDTAKATGGRPPVGPVVNVRLRPDILKRVDNIAADLGMTRAETIRRLVHAGIASGLLGDGTEGPDSTGARSA